jgi:transposase
MAGLLWFRSAMGRRYELSEEQWTRIRPLLPAERGRKARPARSNRVMVNAMLWVLRSGAPWRDLPVCYPPWNSVYTRFSRWTKQGVWKVVLDELAKEAHTEGYFIDATIVRAHQDAHGAAEKGAKRSVTHAEEPRQRFMLLWRPQDGRFDSA